MTKAEREAARHALYEWAANGYQHDAEALADAWVRDYANKALDALDERDALLVEALDAVDLCNANDHGDEDARHWVWLGAKIRAVLGEAP